MCAGENRAAYGNRPVETPEYDERGQAWRISEVTPGMEGRDEDPGIGAAWLVHIVGCPHYSWFVVRSIHLRGERPVKIASGHNSHEILITALDPRHPLPDTDDWYGSTAHFLYPQELVHSFLVRSDEQAQRLTQAVVEHICEGNLPTEDYAPYWRAVVDDTAEHLCYGTHPSMN